MTKVNEKLLQFIWQYQFLQKPLYCINNKQIEVVFHGDLNEKEGPDFLNAKIKYENILHVGNVEIDMRPSNWFSHLHHKNKKFDNVILHIVWKNENKSSTHSGKIVVELQHFVSKILLQKYEQLMSEKRDVLCFNLLIQKPLPPLILTFFFEKLLIERLENKIKKIRNYLDQYSQHWEQVFYVMLMKNFGFSENESAFEEIAISTHITLFAKNKHNENSIYALLLGQANLLNSNHSNQILNQWKTEYDFLKKKYQLTSIQLPLNFGRMLPANFPTIRLAQMAALIYSSKHLFSNLLECKNTIDVFNLFNCNTHSFFQTHYVLTKESKLKSEKKIGKQLIENIIINTICPIIFLYGKIHKQEHLCERSLEWLAKIPSEKNSIVRKFQALKWNIKKANESQAVIELFKNYCSQKKCLSCNVGYELFK